MNKDEALKMAMKGIESMFNSPDSTLFAPDWLKIYNACKEAVEQPAQIYQQMPDGTLKALNVFAPSWQGLSDDEKLAIIRKWKDAHTMREQELIGLGDAIEQALKEKNHA